MSATESWLAIRTVEHVTENDGSTYLRRGAEQHAETITWEEAKKKYPSKARELLEEELKTLKK